MYRFKNIIVQLTLEDADRDLIRYAARLTKLAKAKQIYFCVNLPSFESLGLDVEGPSEDEVRKHVTKTYRGYKNTKANYVIHQTDSTRAILDLCLKKRADLVITSASKNSTEEAEKLARKAPCSVMAVTPESNPAFTKIVVPVDFSNYAKLALDFALAFAESRKIKKIQCVHAFELARGYERTGLSKRKAIMAHQEWAEVEFKAFIKDIDCRGVKVQFNCVQNATTAYAVTDFARKSGSDLLVMGCRGKNALSSWLLGSNTSQVLRSSRIPVLMVKAKGTGKSFLQGILNN